MLKTLLFLLWAILAPFPAFAAEAAAPALLRQTFRHSYDYQGGLVPVAFFDADATLRVDRAGGNVPLKPSDVILLPGVAEKIREVQKQGYFVAIVSNQVNPVKLLGPAPIDATMKETARQAESAGGLIHYFDYSTQNEESKPSPHMFQVLQQKLQEKFGPAATIDLKRSFMVGDAAYRKPGEGYPGDLRPNGRMGEDFANFDRLFAENNGLKYIEPDKFFGWNKFGASRLSNLEALEKHGPAIEAHRKKAGCEEAYAAAVAPASP